MPETALLLARKAADVLAERGIEHARLEAELLLSHVLGVQRLQLYLQFDRPLREDELATYRTLVRRRLRREPVQYIVGTAHFRELSLDVDSRVLIPRPETEELVGRVLEWAWGQCGGKPRRERATLPFGGEAWEARATAGDAVGPEAGPLSPTRRLTALDVGTGSGAIALSLLQEGPFEHVVATDRSADALGVAQANATRLGLKDRLELRSGALWEAVGPAETFDVVVSNPPYVAESERAALAPEVADWEPGGALFAGPDGLDVVGPLIGGAAAHLHDGGLLAVEIGAGHGVAVLHLLRSGGAFGDERVERDLAGHDRFALARRRSLAHHEERREHA